MRTHSKPSRHGGIILTALFVAGCSPGSGDTSSTPMPDPGTRSLESASHAFLVDNYAGDCPAGTSAANDGSVANRIYQPYANPTHIDCRLPKQDEDKKQQQEAQERRIANDRVAMNIRSLQDLYHSDLIIDYRGDCPVGTSSQNRGQLVNLIYQPSSAPVHIECRAPEQNEEREREEQERLEREAQVDQAVRQQLNQYSSITPASQRVETLAGVGAVTTGVVAAAVVANQKKDDEPASR